MADQRRGLGLLSRIYHLSRLLMGFILAMGGADADSASESSLFFSSLGANLGISKMARGYLHSVISLSDNSVWGFGHNSGGQLGDGTTIDRSVPVPINITNVQKIVTGSLHTVFLLQDGRIFATGKNQDGQLGDGTNDDKTVPTDTSIQDVVDVAAGSTHTIFLHSDGSVSATGSNWAGQLGVTSASLASTATPVVVRAAGVLPAVSSVVCGLHHTMLLLDDGTVEAAGWNRDGQLGGGSAFESFVESFTSIDLSNVLEISAGESHTLFRLSDGSVWAAGSGSSGQLGYGGVASHESPVQVDISESITSVSAGGQHSLFLGSSGTAYACGLASSGQLGLNTTALQKTPQQIDLAGVTALSAGYRHSLFLSSEIPLASSGQNVEGQLGDGTFQNHLSPAAVWCCQEDWDFETGSGWTTKTVTQTTTTITVTTTATTLPAVGEESSDMGALMGGVAAGFLVCVVGVLVVCGGGIFYMWKRGLKDYLVRKIARKASAKDRTGLVHPDVEGGKPGAGGNSPVTPAEPSKGSNSLPFGPSSTSMTTSEASGKVRPIGVVDGGKTPTADLKSSTQKTFGDAFGGSGGETPNHSRTVDLRNATTATEIRVAAAEANTPSDNCDSPSLSPITPAATLLAAESVKSDMDESPAAVVRSSSASSPAAAAAAAASSSSSSSGGLANSNNNNSNYANPSTIIPGGLRSNAATGPSNIVVGAAGLAPAPSAGVAAASAAKPGPWRAPGLSMPTSSQRDSAFTGFDESEFPKQSELPPPAGQSAMELLRGSARAPISTPPFPGVEPTASPGPKF